MPMEYQQIIYPLAQAVIMENGQLRDATPEELADLNRKWEAGLKASLRFVDPDEWSLRDQKSHKVTSRQRVS